MGAYDLITVAELIAFMQKTESDFEADAFVIYHDQTGAPTTATVGVSNDTLTLTVDGVPTAIDLTAAANDTLGELETVVNALSGWVANNLLDDSLPSANLSNLGAVSALSETLAQTLRALDTTLLSFLIESTTARVENYLGRGILSRAYSLERYSFRRGSRVMDLKQWPVTVIAGLWLDQITAFSLTNDATDLLAATITISSTTITLYTKNTSGVEISAPLTIASYNTVTEVVAAINGVGDWNATDASETLAADALLAGGPWSVAYTQAVIQAVYHPAANYNLDGDTGMVFFEQSDHARRAIRQLFASYTAGYSETPDDLKQLALELSSTAYDKAAKDQSLLSERLGKYEYENAARDAVAKSAFTAEQQVILNGYKRVRAR